MGSGNESEIFYAMLDKSTYLKKNNLIQYTHSIPQLLFLRPQGVKVISIQIYKMFSWIFIFGHNAKDLSRHG